jgi:hypothetical protein
MTQHTPGPWKIAYDPNFVDLVSVYVDRRSICQIDMPDGEDHANARLIAEAPELLAALGEAAEQLAFCLGSTNKTVERARAAIARATGKDTK